MALNAERHAHEQVEADPTNQEAKDHPTFARVAGYLLLEFFNRRTILSEIPCVSLVKRLISPPQGGDSLHDVIFGVGKWYFDHLLCTSAFNSSSASFCISGSLQFGRALTPRRTQHPSLYNIYPPPSIRWHR